MKACDENGCQYAVHCTSVEISSFTFNQTDSDAHAQHASEKAHIKVEWRAYNVIRNAIEIQLFTVSTEQIMETTKKKGKTNMF